MRNRGHPCCVLSLSAREFVAMTATFDGGYRATTKGTNAAYDVVRVVENATLPYPDLWYEC